MHRNYIAPQSSDILGGRGSKQFNHHGNKLLRFTVASRLDKYSSTSSRQQRSDIITDILDNLRYRGGRFVKFDDQEDAWYDAGYSAARCKIAHSFRDASIPNKVKCIEKIRKSCSSVQQAKNANNLQGSSLEALVSPRGQVDAGLEQAYCGLKHAGDQLYTDVLSDIEPLLHTTIPRVPNTFSCFTGDYNDVDFLGVGLLEEYLDHVSEEIFDELLVRDEHFPR